VLAHVLESVGQLVADLVSHHPRDADPALKATPEFETALTLNRNLVGGLQGLGWCKLFTGSLDDSIPIAEQAIVSVPAIPSTGGSAPIPAVRGAVIEPGAPTGRAAKRLSESTGIEAKTIHRLQSPGGGVSEPRLPTSGFPPLL
jgi:hypothetical protein